MSIEMACGQHIMNNINIYADFCLDRHYTYIYNNMIFIYSLLLLLLFLM